MRTMAGPLTVISLFWYGSAHWQVTPSLSLISFTNSHVLYFFISFIFSLFLHSNAANILMFLILIPWYLFSVHILFRLNSDLGGNRFGFTADGQPGYKKAGADTVYPFSCVKQCSFGVKHETPAEAKYSYARVAVPSGAKKIIFTVAANGECSYWIYNDSVDRDQAIASGHNVTDMEYELTPNNLYAILVCPNYYGRAVTLTGMAYF